MLQHGFAQARNRLITSAGKTGITTAEGKTIEIEGIETEHSDGAVFRTEHHAFIIRGSSTILVTGDADLRKGYFAEQGDDKKVDIMIAPFTGIAQRKIRKSIQEMFAPEMMIIVHLPNPETDEFHYLEAVDKAEEKIRQEGGSVLVMRRNFDCYEWE